MKLKFEITVRSYTIAIERDQMLDLMDSESHVTDDAAYKPGAQTLCDKLGKLPGVADVEYNGHLGAAIYFSISDEDDNDALKATIASTIETHLKWCKKLKKDPRFTAGRQAEKVAPKKGDPVPHTQWFYQAAINCGHEIDSNTIGLFFDAKQPGKNALDQLANRLSAYALSRYKVADEGALYKAAIGCAHEITDEKIVLHFDSVQAGHNALNQLSKRLTKCALTNFLISEAV